MRKILISVLIVLLLVLAFFTVFQGISIGSFQILSANGIRQLNDSLNQKIDDINKKIKVDLQSKQAELARAFDNGEGSTNISDPGLLQAKEAYYDLVNVSTESDINKASTEETYTIEYLMLRIGRHAREEGVNITLEVTSAGTADEALTNINFIVTGQYGAIINFIASLEDDSELSFRIDNFNMTENGSTLQATFDVAGVRIEEEKTSETVDETTDNTTQNNSTTNENTNTTTDTDVDTQNNTVDSESTDNVAETLNSISQ